MPSQKLRHVQKSAPGLFLEFVPNGDRHNNSFRTPHRRQNREKKTYWYKFEAEKKLFSTVLVAIIGDQTFCQSLEDTKH